MSTTRTPREPTPDHPITIDRESARVIVRVGDTVVADSTAALRMQEARYAPVHYVPLYESPYPAVEQIVGHVAFYTDRVSLSVGDPDAAEVA
jgi:uncharacterized protein (DUF427 family)